MKYSSLSLSFIIYCTLLLSCDISNSPDKPHPFVGVWTIDLDAFNPGEGTVHINNHGSAKGTFQFPNNGPAILAILGTVSPSGIVNLKLFDHDYFVGSLTGVFYGNEGDGDYKHLNNDKDIWWAKKDVLP